MIKIREISTNQERLSVHIDRDQTFERELLKKHIAGRSYDIGQKYWSIPYTQETLYKIDEIFKGNYRLMFKIKEGIPVEYTGPFSAYVQNAKDSELKKKFAIKNLPVYANALTALEQSLVLKRYSPSTIRSYKLQVKHLLYYYNGERPSEFTKEQIKAFIYHRVSNEHIAERTQNQMINALKYFYEQVLDRKDIFIGMERPKVPKDLPHHLSPSEIRRLIEAVSNLKHKAIVMTMYSAGLRISELVGLKISDIKSEGQYIRVQSGKGKKDRTTLLSPTLLSLLRDYYLIYKPTYYLFEGLEGGQYSKSSIRKILMKAVAKSGVNQATPHTLRHSFATHLVQSGTDIKLVKELLGHNDIRTTEIYLHINPSTLKMINSPLESLGL